MPKAYRCLLYAHNPYLVYAVHPSGLGGDSCLDFREDPNAESLELWEPYVGWVERNQTQQIERRMLGFVPQPNLQL